ncbi:hypothetical protein ACTMTF_41610 [Nonomuraea sp. ZG12]|uniref:hypothetical protein n=1 Tax=Nonomuraea sp. ZG12 TaxID=3452207 RepID=UPI003F8910E8
MTEYSNPTGSTIVEPSWPARPCCRYGATKAFASAYGHAIAATSHTSVVCLRQRGKGVRDGELWPS